MRSSLIWVCTVCSDLSVPIFKIITVLLIILLLGLDKYLFPYSDPASHCNIYIYCILTMHKSVLGRMGVAGGNILVSNYKEVFIFGLSDGDNILVLAGC